jgi:hypothetical protein
MPRPQTSGLPATLAKPSRSPTSSPNRFIQGRGDCGEAPKGAVASSSDRPPLDTAQPVGCINSIPRRGPVFVRRVGRPSRLPGGAAPVLVALLPRSAAFCSSRRCASARRSSRSSRSLCSATSSRCCIASSPGPS